MIHKSRKYSNNNNKNNDSKTGTTKKKGGQKGNKVEVVVNVLEVLNDFKAIGEGLVTHVEGRRLLPPQLANRISATIPGISLASPITC
jgi:hypothetical protein